MAGRLLVVPLPRFRGWWEALAGAAVGPWGSGLSLHGTGPGGDGALPGGEDPRLPQAWRPGDGQGWANDGGTQVGQSWDLPSLVGKFLRTLS